jgi:hypothetical protein
LHGGRVEEPHAEQLLADFLQVVRPGLDQRLQRRAAIVDGCLVVEGHLPHFIERQAVAEDDAQVANQVAHVGGR